MFWYGFVRCKWQLGYNWGARPRPHDSRGEASRVFCTNVLPISSIATPRVAVSRVRSLNSVARGSCNDRDRPIMRPIIKSGFRNENTFRPNSGLRAIETRSLRPVPHPNERTFQTLLVFSSWQSSCSGLCSALCVRDIYAIPSELAWFHSLTPTPSPQSPPGIVY